MDLKINKRYYDQFPERISQREDRIKSLWKQAIHFTFGDIALNNKVILEVGAGKGVLGVLPPFTPELLIYTEISFNRFRMNKYTYLFPNNSFGVFNDANIPCFRENQFDYIIFVNCLMFVQDKIQLIAQYKTFLKDSGYIVIMEPLSDNPFYKIRKKFTSDYDQLKTKNMTYDEVETVCLNSITVKKGYFYFLSILTASALLKFPDNIIFRKIHAFLEHIDTRLLSIAKMQKWAIVGCAVIKK